MWGFSGFGGFFLYFKVWYSLSKRILNVGSEHPRCLMTDLGKLSTSFPYLSKRTYNGIIKQRDSFQLSQKTTKQKIKTINSYLNHRNIIKIIQDMDVLH